MDNYVKERRIQMLQEKRRHDLGIATIIAFVMTLLLLLVYFDNALKIWWVLTIMVGTVFYHLVMRLAVSWLVAYMPEDMFDWRKERFLRLKPFERKLYKKIRLRNWEYRLPNYQSPDFEVEEDYSNLENVLFAMCEDETIHLLNAGVSFASIIIGPIFFGGFLAFFFSGLLLTVYELAYVASQRYDRRWLTHSHRMLQERGEIR